MRKLSEGDWVRITSFGPVIFKNGNAPKEFGINDIMPDYTSSNYSTVDKSEWLKERYKIIKINHRLYHIQSEKGEYNFITESSGLGKLSILEMVPKN